MSDHEADRSGHDTMTTDGPVTISTGPAPVLASPVDARITEISDDAAESLRQLVEAASGPSRRFAWFIAGFVAALATAAISAAVFLVVSDQDDDGNLDVEVPAVEVDVES